MRPRHWCLLSATIAMTVLSVAAHGYATEPNKGMALYRGHCAACHGIDGGGNGPNASGMTPPPTNFRNATLMHGLPDSTLERAIFAGKSGTAMKGYGTIFNGQDVAAIVKYLRSLAATQ